MAVNIGPKIGIDGEAEYRKEIQGIIQQSKTLAAETNEAAAAFKNATDKEKAGAELKKKLNEQISNQKELVKKLEDAVQKSTEKTGENSTQTQKWKEQLAKAKTELHNMEASAKGSTTEVQKLGDAEEKTGQKTSLFGQMLKANLASAVIQKGLQVTAKIVKDLSAYFVDAVKSSAEYADEINELNVKTGMSTEAIQEWKYASKLIDVEFSTIEGSLTKLTKNMDAARDGSAKQVDAFEKIGVSVVDANGKLRDNNEVFDDVIKKLRELPNDTERDAVAMDILGKSAKELNPLIKANAGTLNELRREAHKVGAVMDRDTLDKLGKVQDGFDRLGLSWDAIKRKLGARVGIKILPDLEKIVDLSQRFTKTGNVGELVGKLIRQLTQDRNWSRTGEKIGDLLGRILGSSPKIIAAGGKLTVSLIKGMIAGIPKMGKAIVEELNNSGMADATMDMIYDLQNLRAEIEKMPDAAGRMNEALGEINGKQREAEHWVEIFDELSRKTNPTAAETERLQEAVDKLNGLYPELGLAIDEDTGKWNLNTNGIRENIKALSDKYKAQAYYSAASQALTDIAMLEAETEKYKEQLDIIKQQRDAMQQVVDRKRDANTELETAHALFVSGEMAAAEYYAFLSEISGEEIDSYNKANKYYTDQATMYRQASSTLENLNRQYVEITTTIDEADAKLADMNKDVTWLFEQGSKWTEAAAETKAGMQQLGDIADQEMERLKETIRKKKKEALAEGKSVGNAVADGVNAGMSEKRGAVIAEAGSLVSSAIARMRQVAQIRSPSRKTRDLIGKNLGLGVVEGYNDVINAAQTRRIFAMSPVFDAMTDGGTVTNNTSTTTNLGGVSVSVYARDEESANEIADRVMRRIQTAVEQRKAVFA